MATAVGVPPVTLDPTPAAAVVVDGRGTEEMNGVGFISNASWRERRKEWLGAARFPWWWTLIAIGSTSCILACRRQSGGRMTTCRRRQIALVNKYFDYYLFNRCSCMLSKTKQADSWLRGNHRCKSDRRRGRAGLQSLSYFKIYEFVIY